MTYLTIKSLHLIFVITWFSGLFYIVRLFVYHAEALEKGQSIELQNQYKIMEKRLWYGITWPSAIFTGIFGLSMLYNFFPLTYHPWLIIKLVFVFGLYSYHLSLGYFFKALQNERPTKGSGFFRVWNEVATLFLVAIVFLAILKSAVNMLYALVGLVVFSLLLMFAIKLYKKLRK